MLHIAIISPNRNAYSESFIQAHKELLQGRISFIYTDDSDRYALDGVPLPAVQWPSPARRLIHAFQRRILKKSVTVPETTLEQFFSTQKVDVVLAEYGPTGLGVLDACRRFKIPLVVHFHGFDASFILKRNPRFYERLFAAKVPLVAVSKAMMQNLLQAGASAACLHYNVYGPHPSFEGIAQKQTPTIPIFLAIGRFVPKKAPHKTIIAFAEVVKQFPEAKLWMAGDGDLADVCKELVHALGLSASVHFLGIQSRAQIQDLMQQATAFVQHSVTAPSGDTEGTPVAILEAMLAGLPIVSTRHAGIPDVVVHEQTGYLCEEGDTQTMANYMIHLARQPLLAREMGSKGMNHVKSNFSLDRHIRSLQELLEKTAAHQ
jgi:glycosyltransferase involved in cell wall biosynthesis